MHFEVTICDLKKKGEVTAQQRPHRRAMECRLRSCRGMRGDDAALHGVTIRGFQNLIPTPVLADDRSFVSVGIGYLFAKKKDRPVPTLPIPSVKTDLQSLDRNRDVVAWLKRQSAFVRLNVYDISMATL